MDKSELLEYRQFKKSYKEWIKHKNLKRKLNQKGLSPEEYEEAIRLFCKANKI
jgi:SOS response regulatory protein OraA/RecX